MSRRRRGRARAFDKAARNTRRRREIERHAIHVGAAETEDLWRWLVAWVWNNPQAKDPVGAIMECAHRIGRKGMSEIEPEFILDEARRTKRRWRADPLAKWLGLTYADRQKLGITTIGAIDANKCERTRRRKLRKRIREQQKRQMQGAIPHSQSAERQEPWKLEGVSRRTWYRHQGAARKRSHGHGTNSCPADFLNLGHELVPPAGKKGDFRESKGVMWKDEQWTSTKVAIHEPMPIGQIWAEIAMPWDALGAALAA
jgi:hypothetical protein